MFISSSVTKKAAALGSGAPVVQQGDQSPTRNDVSSSTTAPIGDGLHHQVCCICSAHRSRVNAPSTGLQRLPFWLQSLPAVPSRLQRRMASPALSKHPERHRSRQVSRAHRASSCRMVDCSCFETSDIMPSLSVQTLMCTLVRLVAHPSWSPVPAIMHCLQVVRQGHLQDLCSLVPTRLVPRMR